MTDTNGRLKGVPKGTPNVCSDCQPNVCSGCQLALTSDEC